jgi:peroxiredoxin
LGLFHWFVALRNRNVTSGVGIGQPAPDFSLRDQNGRVRSLHDVSGPKGLLLVFVRSADW